MENTSKGFLRLGWARERMDVTSQIRERFIQEKPLKGVKISMALHVEAKTGIFALLLREGGAEIRMASCNPLSSDDSVVQSLKDDYKMDVYAKKGETDDEYYEYLNKTLDLKPNVIIDDGGDLVKIVSEDRTDLLDNIIGGNEETTTGVVRLFAMEKAGALKFPMFDVNDAEMKHFFDNRYGTGQSTLDGIMSATNVLLAGKKIVVAGYGWCGKGIAMRMKGLGGLVTVTEINPVKAVEAAMDGFDVKPMNLAIREADLVVTATGMKNVVSYSDLLVAKKNLILANSGHFNNEIPVRELETKSLEKRPVRESINRYKLENGNTIDLIADGRLVNLAAGQGHPVEIMDMSFSIQALTAEYLVKNHQKLEKKVYPVPRELDLEVANLKLKGLDLSIDRLTDEQTKYGEEWKEGT
ncbi:MAG: adenosylhomocysteinase [Candidatus Thermoplasmatota archaeon]|jgi:adenosylhomocysteinase|nr:adenosylhomocysteinase [Candidatus Thermoplasmatota archaeon]MCL5955384.1 adenosylhomocysteinase [Candidatus Thermoplasmatota archaeon]